MIITKINLILLTIFLCFLSSLTKAQERGILFTHLEYQPFNYSFLTAGVGYSPYIMKSNYHPEGDYKYSFAGYTLNYSRSLKNNDWGTSFQLCVYPGEKDGFLAAALEG